MGRRRLVPAVAAGICVAALGLGLNGAASASPAGRFSVRTVVLNCLGHPQVRPGRFTLACADANDYLTGLVWKSWGPRLASATGVQSVNDCVPYCAAGHFHRYRWTSSCGTPRRPARAASATPRSHCSTRVLTRPTPAAGG